MEEIVTINPNSLKCCCLCVIRRNRWLEQNIDLLNYIPSHLLLDLCQFVSPFGLSLLEEKIDAIECYKVDHLYLTQWAFPASYRLKARVRKRRMIQSADDTITNKQFFYNGLLNEVIEKMIYPHKLGIVESIKLAWEYLLQYPTNYAHERTSRKCEMTNHSLLLDMLSSNATCLMLTPSTVFPIVNNLSTLSLVLQSVECISIKATATSRNSQDVIKSIEVVLKHAQDYNLRSIDVECIDSDFKSFNEIVESICRHVKQPGKRTEGQVKTIALDNFVEIYDFECSSSYDGSNSDDDNLFNDVFKRGHMFSTPITDVIDTKINDFRLYSPELNWNLKYFFDKISKWRSLQKLVICGECVRIEDSIISNALLALARYNNLKDLTLVSFFYEIGIETSNALITLTKPSCQRHDMHKCLERLKIGMCECSLFISLLQSTYHCVDATDECISEGLRSLEVTLCGDHRLFHRDLVKNDTLKELKITKGYNEEDDDYLINCVAGISLETFSISSEYIRGICPPPRSVKQLLQNSQLKHLAIDLICNCGNFFDDDEDENVRRTFESVLSASKLNTLVWTNNGLGNEGLIQIAGLIPYLPYLRVLDLSGNIFNIDAVSVFLLSVHQHKHYFDKLSLGGPHVRLSDIKTAGLGWILEEYAKVSLVSFMEMSALEHVAQM